MSGPKQKWRANNDWLLESKSDMKARGLRSSDLSDACALTFATKEWFDTWTSPDKSKGFGAGVKLREVAGAGIGDHDRFFEADVPSDYGWMG